MNAALILSGGKGTRFGSPVPKQYHRIFGRMVISYVLDAVKAARKIDTIIVAGTACPPLNRLKDKYGFETVPGGAVRNETLQNGLDALEKMGCDKVIILDAVRPLVTAELVDTYMNFLEDGWDAVSTVQPITDSLGCLDQHVVDRSRYYLMQSPEAYDFHLLYKHFDKTSHLTEVAHQLPETTRLMLYKDFPQNPKLTYPWEKSEIAYALYQHHVIEKLPQQKKK